MNIDEAFVFAETKGSQWQFVCHCGELRVVLMSFAVMPATNAELVQMFARPAHDYLDDIAQLRERQVLGNEDPPPNRRAQALQDDLQLEDGDRRLRVEGHEHIVGGSLCSCLKTDLSHRFGALSNTGAAAE
ncbi:hypothetical protein P3W83_22820 [Cupriavidus basilensis]|nr:hypothetical protein [Cupriavidus basilensis]MDF3885267.1 hypothetical protein [Cupriavidus basilensis]